MYREPDYNLLKQIEEELKVSGKAPLLGNPSDVVLPGADDSGTISLPGIQPSGASHTNDIGRKAPGHRGARYHHKLVRYEEKQRKRGTCCEVCGVATSNQANRFLGGRGSYKLHTHHIYKQRLYPEKVGLREFQVRVCQECHNNIEGKIGSREQVITWGRAIILRQICTELHERSSVLCLN